MEENILQILEKNNRIIVPEFGAFIVKQRKPLSIIFNEFLQYNDGMLINYITKNENISREEAKKLIGDFVTKVTAALKNDSEYELGKIGVLEKNSAGKISIKTTDTKPSPKVSAPIQEKAKTTEEITETKTLDIQESEEKKTEEKKAEQIEKKEIKKTPAVESAPIPKEDIASVEENVKTDAPEKPIETSKTEPQVKNATPGYSKPVASGNKKKQNMTLWIIIIAVNVALISYFVLTDQFKALTYDEYSEDEINLLDEEINVPVDSEKITSEIEPSMTEKNEEPDPDIYTTSLAASNKYFIVAGVFRDEQNADNLVLELRQQGFEAEKFGKIGSLHAVSYSGHITKEEAVTAMRKIQQSTNPEAWIRTIK